jgi:leader peptidase (prepilin peptidase)/N-methyltransferase
VLELQAWSHTAPAGAFAVVLGLLWGSFANVCIYRWPAGKSVVKPGSHCGSCGTPIAWYDNVPVLSYLWLRGQCRACQAHFSARYMLVELVTGVLFGVAWWFTLGTGGMFAPEATRLLEFVVDASFVFVMIVIAFIDLDTKLILNRVTVPSTIVFYAASLALHHRWWQGLVGIAVGYGVPWLIGEIYIRIRDQEGLGLGDSTMLAAVGALLGWQGALVALFGGAMLGSVIGVAALLMARANAPAPAESEEPAPTLLKSELPFGPFLAMGAVFYVFAAPWIELHFRL